MKTTKFSGTKMRDRCRVPKGAWTGPPLVPGMVVPQGKGAFRFRALLYCAHPAALWTVFAVVRRVAASASAPRKVELLKGEENVKSSGGNSFG